MSQLSYVYLAYAVAAGFFTILALNLFLKLRRVCKLLEQLDS